MLRLVFSVVLLVLAAFTTDALARKWRDSSGVFSVEGELVSHNASTVTLKAADGRVIQVPLTKLSQADRKFLAARAAQDPKAAGRQPAPDLQAVTKAALRTPVELQFLERR